MGALATTRCCCFTCCWLARLGNAQGASLAASLDTSLFVGAKQGGGGGALEDVRLQLFEAFCCLVLCCCCRFVDGGPLYSWNLICLETGLLGSEPPPLDGVELTAEAVDDEDVVDDDDDDVVDDNDDELV